MSEVAENPPTKQEGTALQPPTDAQGHPVREWIDTLLQAAGIAKDKQKTPAQSDDKAAVNPTDATAAPDDASVSTTVADAKDAAATDATTSESNKEDEDKESSPTVSDTKDVSMDPAADEAKPGEGASAPAPKRYRRRRCEIEGCSKFARFNNACSGHGGRRLCAEAGCERVAQFGHKCSAHGGIKFCSVEGCQRAVQSRGCCKTHGGGVRCQYPDCTKGAISKGFCRSHGGGSRCAEEGCEKWAQRHGYCVRHSKSSSAPKATPIQRAREPSVVDIACKERSSDCYSGNEKARQSVDLKFGDFVDYYQATFRKQSHWLQTVGGLEFYLAQCPIAVPKPDATCTKASLPAIMNHFRIPACLQGKSVTQVNLWMTVQPGRTTLHYDAYQNILVVLYGKKVVTLYPPSDTAKMYPYPVHTKSTNHSQVNIVQPDFAKHPRFKEASAQRFEVAAGDAVLIPEGWWHQVDSDEFTVAVNYWWNGVRDQLVEDPRMAPYYGRVMLEELVKQQCESRLSAVRSSAAAGTQSTFQDERRVVAAIVAANSQETRERIFLSLDATTFVKTQRLLATDHAPCWRELLANASVDLVMVLADCWESDDFEVDLLGVLFGALESEEDAVKEQLVAKQAQFRRECAVEMYQSLFG
uniref:JmjC domain-containing protein n=1 Tax=Phytophthora ramorum TaxID=164328 RepID=H3GJ11_PHYRM